jgi:hypothetical protein
LFLIEQIDRQLKTHFGCIQLLAKRHGHEQRFITTHDKGWFATCDVVEQAVRSELQIFNLKTSVGHEKTRK